MAAKGFVTGSAGNISFLYDNEVYISKSGTLFGRLSDTGFAKVRLDGTILENGNPSKEYPMHLELYQKQNIKAVLHTHSFYTTLWSCLEQLDTDELIPSYTPYLNMQFKKIKQVPYDKPGSEELFQAFAAVADNEADGYILKNHGAFVTGNSMQEAYAKLAELETSAKMAWYLNGTGAAKISY